MLRIKRHFAQAAAAVLSTYLVAAAVPPTITAAVAAPMYFNYQGRLKKDGKAVNDFRYFRFRLTDETGSSEYYTSGSTRIYVTNGLFNYKVGPLGGVNFDANPLYMEVSVGESAPDNLLLPREALISSPYAIYAASAAYSVDSGALSSRNYSAFVSTRAENQTIAGVKTFTGAAAFVPSVTFTSATFSGNVGIGTNDPMGKLHIVSESSADPYVFVTNHVISGYGIMVSTSNAFVVIGSPVPLSGNKFQVNGSAGKTVGGTTWADLSDIRLKNIKGEISGALEQIQLLRPIKFEWNEIRKKKFGDDPGTKYGFAAQEIKEVFPEFVTESPDGYLWYNPSGYEAVLTAAVKELTEVVKEQQLEIENLKKILK